MVGSMTSGAVVMAVAVVPREETIDKILQVGVRPRSELHECESGRRVRREDVDKSVAFVPTERNDVVGDVLDSLP